MKLIKIIMILLVLFILYNLIWGLYYVVGYKPYKNKISETNESQIYEKDGYVFDVSKLSYLTFTFNLSISEIRYMNNSGDDISGDTVDMIVWIKPFSKKEYGVSVFCGDMTDVEDKYNLFDVMVDLQGQPLEQLSEENQKIYNKNKDRITKLITEYNYVWGKV